MNVSECWFCGAPARPGDQLHVAMTRDSRDTFIVIGVYRRWKQVSVFVPRCGRCRMGHAISRALNYIVAGSAAITGLMLLAWGASRASGERWADEWQLLLPVVWTIGWLVLWWGMHEHWFTWRWLAPRPERYAREYPPIQELAEQGWK